MCDVYIVMCVIYICTSLLFMLCGTSPWDSAIFSYLYANTRSGPI